MTKFRTALVALASLLAAGPASAANFSCSVDPAAYLGLNAGGWMVTAVNGGPSTQICNINVTVGDVNPEVCAAWYSSLLTWRTIGKSGVIYFTSDNSTNQNLTSCGQFSPWEVHFPYYIDAA